MMVTREDEAFSAAAQAIVLRYDRRRIVRLGVPPGAMRRSAELLAAARGPVAIVTGFYIARASAAETDGPPGTMALVHALKALGKQAAIITDDHCADVLRAIAGDTPVYVMPAAADAPQGEARTILAAINPSLLVAVERCGPDANGRFLQFDGTDITVFTGHTEHLFAHGVPSIGVVDSGNEVGIGSYAAEVAALEGLPMSPCLTATDETVIAGVANWGCYGIAAELSRLTGQRVLSSAEEEVALRRATVDAGAVDGDSCERIVAVDGFSGELSTLVLERLHRLLG